MKNEFFLHFFVEKFGGIKKNIYLCEKFIAIM